MTKPEMSDKKRGYLLRNIAPLNRPSLVPNVAAELGTEIVNDTAISAYRTWPEMSRETRQGL